MAINRSSEPGPRAAKAKGQRHASIHWLLWGWVVVSFTAWLYQFRDLIAAATGLM